MLALTEAFKTRWTAKSLSTTITGGVHHSRSVEETDMPYAIFSEVSDTPRERSRDSEYVRSLIQVDVYDETPDLAGSHIRLVKHAFKNADKASSNPFTISASEGVVKNISVTAGPTVFQESDEVYRGTLTLAIDWAEARNLVPS